MADNQPKYTEEQLQAWVRTKFQEANKYLAEQGIISDQILSKDSRYLAPLVAVWKFSTSDKHKIWVINGDVPTDMVTEKVAQTARDAVRHFALNWQLKADAILRSEQPAQEQRNYANYLINRAENLYQLFEQEKLWEQQA
ncbi:MAG: DUF4826 family protein [Gammaproteobacteria bacterium]|jgi:hypothetical protein|nr:DUF4826 family protein [Gammaproteobacteria bacterium]